MYLKCIPYGFMISLKCGVRRRKFEGSHYIMDYSTFANSNLLFCSAGEKEMFGNLKQSKETYAER